MLKAVRFDEEKHKDLLDYIEKYRDNKEKPNHSEAIRFLMEKGFESVTNSQISESKIENQPINVDSIKNEVYTDIMEELTKKFFSQMGVQSSTLQQTSKPVIANTEVKKDPPPKPKPSPPRVVPEGTGLLANLLGNANR